MSTPPSPPEDSGQLQGEDYHDCFAPPKEPCECYCLHCHRVFMSDGIWFQRIVNGPDPFDGTWMCPTPNCDGIGFSFDIFPTDPNHPANEGWVYSDDGEEDEFDPDDDDSKSAGEYDPAEPKYAAFDEAYGDDDDDLEGEEWKHGLEPGQRPPEPAWVEEARKHWEEEQKRYDGPDERPREIDGSQLPAKTQWKPGDSGGEITESDIPF